MVGQTLAHYKILEKIGSGGMGDVYLAEDTKLDRKIALKVLPPELAENEERRARFQREAKAIAALNHPNIVTVHSVEEADGVHFITMQLVRGKTLTELLPKNGFPLIKFFDIAIPLTDAVAAAHQEGITHRDLKPDNMMVSDDDRVEVLDFGLAKPSVGVTVSSEALTAAKTAAGVIVGTVAYMSPEQAEGKSLDTRSDIFSLGIMFFEMLTGSRPFTGETAPAVLSSVLKDSPPVVTEIRSGIPRDLARLVRRCLVKDPTRRYQSALDVRNELEEIRTETASEAPVESVAPRSRQKVFVGMALAFLAGALLSRMLPIGDRARDPMDEMRLVNPVQVTSSDGTENVPTWSPDAGRLAYESNESGNWDIWVAQVGGASPVNLTADHDGDDRSPSWSPDGREIAFFSNRNDSTDLYSIPSLGGSPRKLLTLPLSGLSRPSWSQDGTSVLVQVGSDMMQVLQGSDVMQVLHLPSGETNGITLPNHESNAVINVSWSPDGRWLSYVEGLFSSINPEVSKLWIVSFEGGEPIPVTDGLSRDLRPTWSADGRTLFFVSNRGGAMDLWRQHLREDRTPLGQAVPVSTGIEIQSFAFSADGTKLAVSRGRRVSNVWRVPILTDRLATWADAEQLTADNAFAQYFDLAPDGRHLVIGSDRAGNQDLWLVSLDDGRTTQLTTHPAPDDAPRFSPDATEIVFRSYRSGDQEIWVIPAEGGPGRQLTFHPGEDSVPVWSPDGDEIAFSSRRAGNRDVWVVPAEGGEPRPVTTHEATEYIPMYSPDGEWISFQSDREARHQRLWRRRRSGGELERIADGPARTGVWSPDGHHIYYTGTGSKRNLWAVSLEDGREYPITELDGRRGDLGYAAATDGVFVYFTWFEDLGDIWVMDVVTDED